MEFRDSAYAFLLDRDEVNGAAVDLDAVRRAIGFLDGHADCAAVFLRGGVRQFRRPLF